MPLAAILLKPGLDVEITPTFDSATYAEVSYGRFKSGLFQKIGGWTRFYPFAVDGFGRDLHPWQDLNQVKHLAVGTTEELDVITNGVLIEITPQELLTNSTAGIGTVDAFTSSLLHLDGTDGSTTITDETGKTWTAAGNAQIDTAQSVFGGASLLLDGTGDYVDTPDHADFNLGSSNFTINFWGRIAGAAGVEFRACGQTDAFLSAAGSSFQILRTTSNVIQARLSDGTTFHNLNGTTAITDAEFHQITFVRSGNVIYLFVDRVLEATAAFTGTVPDSAGNFGVGSRGGGSTLNLWNGWIDEFSIRVGVAQWIDDFSIAMISTTSGLTTIDITDTGITNVTTDDSVEFLTPVSVGGIILSGIYRITARTGADSYQIESRQAATATEIYGGTVPEFDTTLNSARVQVTLADHAQAVGNVVVFPIPTDVGGVTIQGKYDVVRIVTADVFEIAITTAATSTDSALMNDGRIGFRYYIALGPSGGGLGYGLGGYGLGPYGLGGGAGAVQTGTAIDATDWSLDNWGDLLIANPEDRGIFYWGPSSGFINAQLIVEAPAYCSGVIMSQAQRQLVAYGASINAWATGGIGIYQDPLRVAWCDVENFFDWEARAENQAGGFTIPLGSEIVSMLATKNRNLLWTDLELWAEIYIGQPFVYSHNVVGSNCGLIGKHAAGQFGDAAYWMGKSNFFTYAGQGVQPIPCNVWDEVFQDINEEFADRSWCASNTDFTEIWFGWTTASGGQQYPDKIAKYNIVENTWEILPIDRLAWIDRSVLGSPIAIDRAGLIYYHENGYNMDGSPIPARFKTAFFYIEESQDFVYIDEIIPDFKWGTFAGAENAQIQLTVHYVDDTPGSPQLTSGPLLVTKESGKAVLDPPIRATQVALEVYSEDVDSFWRLGRVRFRWAPSGRVGG